MRLPKHQYGLSSLGWLVVLSLVGFFLLCTFRLGPAYIDDRMIKGVIVSVAEANPDLHSMSKMEIKSAIQKFLTINSVRGEASKNIKIVKRADRTLINNRYEVRVHLFANIDVVMNFEHQLDSSNVAACCEYLIPDEE
ncbi:DUF4845 domain-containing protein [Teredinibacter sp. KSP-S5-2]|uniref:DUF4845 domain-containing protein n=1 Tax=Teredinibacter sp. KSP-S5-2 TaxID=3034506 RepID=UPI0029346C1D|nr:DUF4845 domain-containing protein [Teredinibacter sp. KSP-S5-2]WNO08014.1 DUF4845 domain-containing protein [Teredinibacter sp. KSP-S5-2]